jgi:hypothetical protein
MTPILVFGLLAVTMAERLEQISTDTVPPGTEFRFSAQEVNEYARTKANTAASGALSHPRILLGTGSVTGFVKVDFVKLRESAGDPPGWVFKKLFSGEKDLRVDVKVACASQKCQLDIRRAEVAGVVIQGAALEYLLQSFVLPYYPDVVIGKPFELDHNVDRFEISPFGVNVVLAP